MYHLRATSGLLLGSLSFPALADSLPSTEEMWRMLKAQQAEIESLRAQLADTTERVEDTVAQVQATAEVVDQQAREASHAGDTRIGGYGELHYNNLDSGKEIDFHRFVLFFNHEFSEDIRLFSELEVEHSIAGDGQNGEVELEQAFIEFDLKDGLSAKAGLFLLPIGILNETHEPTTFYGVERNDVESIIIPSTWWESRRRPQRTCGDGIFLGSGSNLGSGDSQ